MQEKRSLHVWGITFCNLKEDKLLGDSHVTLKGKKKMIKWELVTNIMITPIKNYLNNVKLLQESIINATMKQEDGKDIKENIHFRFVMS